jgi:uncharacterized protein YbaP (TraB family)
MSLVSVRRCARERRLALALLVAAWGPLPCGAFDVAPGPFVWRVTGTELTTPSYLFGTIHVGGAAVNGIAAATRPLLERADVLVTEIPMDPATLQQTQMLFLAPEEAPGLSERLGPALSTKVAAHLGERFPGISLGLFERFEPWAFYLSLMGLEVQSVFPGQALDMQLFLRARVEGIETDALETVEEQIDALKALTDEDVRQLLAAELAEDGSLAEAEASLRGLLEAYLRGDLEGFMTSYLADLESLEVSPTLVARFMQSLLYDRDRRMAERIVERLQTHPDRSYFFAVGAMHLAGEDAIPARLAAAGFTLERLPTTLVVPAAGP